MGDEARCNYRLDKCESQQTGAKHGDAGHGAETFHSEETFGSEFIRHGTPPVPRPCSNGTTVPPHSQRVFPPNTNFDAG